MRGGKMGAWRDSRRGYCVDNYEGDDMKLYKCLTCGHVVESAQAGFDKMTCPHCSAMSEMLALTDKQAADYRKHHAALGKDNCYLNGAGHFMPAGG